MPSNARLMKEVQEAQRQMAAEFAAVRESEEDDGEQRELAREVECAVRGVVAFGEGTRRTDGLRRRLLPAWRRGESDQGAEVFTRWKFAVRANACEPNPAVPMFVRLRVVHAAAAVRAGGNGNVASSMPHVRERLFKIGGLVRVTTRRVWAHFSSSYPDRELFAQVSANLRRHAFFPM